LPAIPRVGWNLGFCHAPDLCREITGRDSLGNVNRLSKLRSHLREGHATVAAVPYVPYFNDLGMKFFAVFVAALQSRDSRADELAA